MAQVPSAKFVEQAAALLAEHPAKAEEQARAILKIAPNDPRALLILGSARRRQGDPTAAYRVLAPLAKTYPRAANTHYELGATLADLGRTAEAIVALRQTVTLNPDLPEPWRALGQQLFREGEIAAAEAAFAGLLCVSIRKSRVEGGCETALARPRGRRRAYTARLFDHPSQRRRSFASDGRDTDAYGAHADAETLLAHCLKLDPSQDDARQSYASALFNQQKATEAALQAERLLRRAPDDPAYLNLLAACLGLVGEDERVGEIYQRLSADYPKHPLIWLNYGHALRAVGKSPDAIAAYRTCIALAPSVGEAYWGLANMKLAAFTAEEETAMLAEVARPDLTSNDRLHLHYALGKAFEDRREYAASFDHYRRAAEIRHASVPYDADETTALLQRSKAIFAREFFAERAGAGFASNAPIFIVGLPRSGSTLIEQILASHSAVEGTRELPDMGFIASDLGWKKGDPHTDTYAVTLTALDPADLEALGRSYVDKTRIHRKLDKPHFIDKMPNNFQHIGLIHSILPNAKIIDARRHPLGACFSSFKQHFAQGQAFSYDLSDLGRYYRDYSEMMAHFDRVLPGRIHRVIYEDLVDDVESVVRRLLDYCGLPFEDGCLKFYETARAVRTVSSEQVRRPVFRDAVEQWRRYEPWLDPLKAALGPALDDWRGQ